MRRTKTTGKDFITSELVYTLELRVSKTDLDAEGIDEIEKKIARVEAEAENQGFQASEK